MNTEKFICWLTGIVLIGYMAVSGYAFAKTAITWADFSGAVGPVVGTLVGYFIRGSKS